MVAVGGCGGAAEVGGGATGMRSGEVTWACDVVGTVARVAVVSSGGSEVVSSLPLEQLAKSIKTPAAIKIVEKIIRLTFRC